MTDKTISIPIYDFFIRVLIADTLEEFEEVVFDAGYEESVKTAGAIVFNNPYHTKSFVVAFNKDDISVGNIAHEALHVTNRVLEDVGVVFRADEDEPHAYLLGFLVDCLHKIIDDEDRN